MDLLHDCLSVNSQGHLTIGGLDALELAAEFGTPAYIIDSDHIRRMCRSYKNAMHSSFGEGSLPVFASKALSYKGIYRLAAEEGIAADSVSSGELYTAHAAGFPMERIYFHGNNKTDADLELALEYDVGTIVVDGIDELCALDRIAERCGKRQNILLRITPGIDPHTHRAITTGNVDSKFGSPIQTGAAMEIVKRALSLYHVKLSGFHCHVGSQIFETQPFEDAAGIMLKFISDVRAETGFEAAELNLGGGFGVRYISEHRGIDIEQAIAALAQVIRTRCGDYSIKMPVIRLEPGRSIVAGAGITLYTVGSVKEIRGFRNYVSVDGGMPDNPRYALYSSQYTILNAARATEAPDYCCTIAGRCCESGDLIAENVRIQPSRRGDILAVLTTGAYNYSMASNYNRIPRPPIIEVSNGEARVAVRRESLEDLIRNDL